MTRYWCVMAAPAVHKEVVLAMTVPSVDVSTHTSATLPSSTGVNSNAAAATNSGPTPGGGVPGPLAPVVGRRGSSTVGKTPSGGGGGGGNVYKVDVAPVQHAASEKQGMYAWTLVSE